MTDSKIIAQEQLGMPKQHPMTGRQLRDEVLNVVLVRGDRGDDYAAYWGLGSDHFVTSVGNKLPFSWAVGFFPFIDEKHYRS